MSNIKRKGIKEKIRRVAFLIALVSIVVVGAVALSFMFLIKGRLENSLVTQMESQLTSIVDSRAEIAYLKLQKYCDYLRQCQDTVNFLYEEKDKFKLNKLPNYHEDMIGYSKNEFKLQRGFKSKEIDKTKVSNELSLFSNLESMLYSIMSKESGNVVAIYLTHESGFNLSYDNNLEKAKDFIDEDGDLYFDLTGRPWYVNAMKGDDVVISNLEQDTFGRGLTLTCSIPIKKQGVNVGVIGMDILVTDLQKEIIDVNLGVESYSFIVNANGDIVASLDVTLDQTEFENITKAENKFNDVGFNILKNESAVESSESGYYVAHNKVNGTDWTLCIAVPKDIVLAPVTRLEKGIFMILYIFAGILLFICFIVIVISNTLSEDIVRPILDLRNDVEDISSGNLNKVVTEHGNDEITDLAKSFNSMTASLKKYISDLTAVTAEKERIGAELDVAKQIQASMLPDVKKVFEKETRFKVNATMTPAKEVGGDFYDCFMIDKTHLAFVVADVSGKGVPAALFMAIGKTIVKDLSNAYGNDLSKIFTDTNKSLCEANSEGLFITAFEAVIDLETGDMHYVNAGHEMPFIYKKGGSYEALKMKHGFVLAGVDSMKYESGSIKLSHGDKIFQYTDGVTEATNSQNELYGMERLEKILNESKDLAPIDLLPVVRTDIDKFVAGAPQFDDITMFGFEYI